MLSIIVKTMKTTMIMIGTLPYKQTLPQHKVYREVARTLAQMHSIELPEGRRSPGAFPSDLFELRLNKKIMQLIKMPNGRPCDGIFSYTLLLDEGTK